MLLFGWVYVYLFIPETKGLSLEEVSEYPGIRRCPIHLSTQVDEMYRSGVKPWNSANWKPHLMDEMHKQTGGEAKESSEKEAAQD
jgi:hypothetical protein